MNTKKEISKAIKCKGSNKNKYLLYGKNLLLSYNPCTLELDVILCCLQRRLSNFPIESYLLVKGDSVIDHVHVYLVLTKNFNSISENCLDLVLESERFHGNYQTVKQANKSIDYLLKDIRNKEDESRILYSKDLDIFITKTGGFLQLEEAMVELAESGRVKEYIEQRKKKKLLFEAAKLTARVYQKAFRLRSTTFFLTYNFCSLDLKLVLGLLQKKFIAKNIVEHMLVKEIDAFCNHHIYVRLKFNRRLDIFRYNYFDLEICDSKIECRYELLSFGSNKDFFNSFLPDKQRKGFYNHFLDYKRPDDILLSPNLYINPDLSVYDYGCMYFVTEDMLALAKENKIFDAMELLGDKYPRNRRRRIISDYLKNYYEESRKKS